MTKDLTVGNPGSTVLKFTFPLLISVIFQQIYNIADSIIVGNFAADGESALAAVGASYSITMIFVAVAIGSNSGCSVVISQLFGSKRGESLKCAVSTSVIAAAVLSIIMSAAGLVFSEPLLRLINTPENIMQDSVLYLNIYIAGFIFLFMYNIGNGIFTALGDSVTPLIFLIASSVVNIILDLVFVRSFHWDVAGVAWATFITQGAAGVLSVAAALYRTSKIKTGKYKLFSVKMLGTVGAYAIPSILQQSFVSVGNIFVQNLVNGFGSSVVAGYSAAVKLNTFCITSVSTLGNGISGFAAQNIGAAKYDRVRSGMRSALFMSSVVALIFTAAYVVFPDSMISMFVPKEDMTALALESGSKFLIIASPFYVLVGIKIVCDGILRGGGAMAHFMITTFLDLVLRVILAYIFCGVLHMGYLGIWMSWPVGWTASSAVSLVFYLTGAWRRGKLVR